MNEISKFDIIFTSLDTYRQDVQYRQVFETIEQDNSVRTEFEYIKDYMSGYSIPDTIGFTKA
ncbi:MAG: hypothetical protein Ta2B_10790 [Termitinemataceae bacterium]|nr:MAG: hypothetical protein Ta2B_10790 [Termitinemataceae bacterium]